MINATAVSCRRLTGLAVPRQAGRNSGARLLLLAIGLAVTGFIRAEVLTLDRAVTLAQENDPWLRGSEFRQRGQAAERVAAGSLPDPELSLGVANLPVDTLDVNQEAMTQFRVGLSQMFPPGDSRALKQQQLGLLESQHPQQRLERRARVRVTVSHLWLDAWRAGETLRLIEQDRALFNYLAEIAEAGYAAGLGRSRQQDLVRAQLELTRLEDRLLMLHQRRETALGQLTEWLGGNPDDGPAPSPSSPGSLQLPDESPRVELLYPALYTAAANGDLPPAPDLLLSHPAVAALERRIEAGEVGVDLAQQKFKPRWGVNSSYAYRDDDPAGNERSDFFSLGLSFSLPLFAGNRQDQELQAARAGAEAVRTERALLLRNMAAAFESARARLLRLNQRQALYQSRLLTEMQAQAEIALNAYTSDTGDFAEVVRARIAELNARIDALDIDIDRLKTVVELNYFFTDSSKELATAIPGESP